MAIITKILSSLVALEFIYIFYLETIKTSSATTGRVFGMTQEELKRDTVKTLFQNQGVYNLLIAVMILIALYFVPSPIWLGILLVYILLVAIYGGISSHPSIILKQGGLALLSLLSLCIWGL